MSKEAATTTVVYVILSMLVVLAWGIAFGDIKSDVKHIEKRTDSQDVSIKRNDDRVDSINSKLTRIDTRQEVVIETLRKIEKKLP